MICPTVECGKCFLQEGFLSIADSLKGVQHVVIPSQGKDCYICKKGGHRARNCPEKSIAGLQKAKLCLKCGDLGHEMFTCNSAYSVEDLKEVQCYICKDFGHLCCVDYGEGPGEVSCYRCQLGHNGLKRKRKTAKDDHLKGYNDQVGVKSAPHELGEARKRNKRQHGRLPSPQPKRRGRWINEDHVHYNIGTQWGPLSTQHGDSASSQPMYRGGWINEDLGDRYNGVPIGDLQCKMDTQLHLNRIVGVGGSIKILITITTLSSGDLRHQLGIDLIIVSMKIMVLVVMGRVFNMKLQVLMDTNTGFQHPDLAIQVIIEGENMIGISSLGGRCNMDFHE